MPLSRKRLWRRRKLSKVEKLDVSLHLPLISKFYFDDPDGHSLELFALSGCRKQANSNRIGGIARKLSKFGKHSGVAKGFA